METYLELNFFSCCFILFFSHVNFDSSSAGTFFAVFTENFFDTFFIVDYEKLSLCLVLKVHYCKRVRSKTKVCGCFATSFPQYFGHKSSFSSFRSFMIIFGFFLIDKRSDKKVILISLKYSKNYFIAVFH